MAPRKKVAPLRGVNLGGWLVLEKWMTPSVFAGSAAVDEYTFSQLPDAAKRLKQHRDTFITKQDFIWLAEQGIQTVRLPVGYWLFGNAAPYHATVSYVDKAFRWAHATGIRVLLDFHGAPGSQNGHDHSGQIGAVEWPHEPHIQQTLAVLEAIAQRYGHHPLLLGIELLNEPSLSIPQGQLEAFYRQTIARLQPLCKSDIWFVCSDGFRPKAWYKRLPAVHIDHHQYQLFGRLDRLLSVSMQLWRAQHWLPRKVRSMAANHPVIIGEWSGALRAEKLARSNAAERPALTRRYIHAQLQAFSATDAWFYWSYKTEAGGAWSYRDCVERGLLR